MQLKYRGSQFDCKRRFFLVSFSTDLLSSRVEVNASMADSVRMFGFNRSSRLDVIGRDRGMAGCCRLAYNPSELFSSPNASLVLQIGVRFFQSMAQICDFGQV